MSDDRDAVRSSAEIKALVRKLHPDRGNHKDRLRRLAKFRNYVMGDGRGASPEFYDDDLPLLLLGSSAPAAYIDDDDDGDGHGGGGGGYADFYGLMQACGTPSSEKEHGALKRSARHAMNLLKWLLQDWRETGQKKDDLNGVALSFLQLPVQYYQHLRLDLHVLGDDRGGAKLDACEVLVLILSRHLSEDGETLQAVALEELLPHPKTQHAFELWMARHCTASTQEVVRKNRETRQAELALLQRQDALLSKVDKQQKETGETADSKKEKTEKTEASGDHNDNKDDDDDAFADQDDVMAAIRKRKKNLLKELKEAEGRGEIEASHGVATRWEDSQLAREQRARQQAAIRAGQHETVRDSQKAAQEAAVREEEKAKILGKDPLGIVMEQDFDLPAVENSQAEQMEQALHEMQEYSQKTENNQKVQMQKESLEALVDRMGGIEAMEQKAQLQYSVLPSSPKFDPILFLTLVHRTTSYDALVASLGRLSSKTETQAEELQNLVRDNFPLFVRCAEGFEEFRQSSEDEVGMGASERVDKLEAIAESCSFQAKKSFKPLLDNTSEVRKVQSAMAVLQRVAPILQVPTLMRQHIENRRYSQALKTFRRVLVIEDNCKIELLNHVKHMAEQCVRDARRDLESRLAQATVPVDDLLDGIRDLGELLELDVAASKQLETSESMESNNQNNSVDDHNGVYEIGGAFINCREHPPALACLLLQAAHFAYGVYDLITSADETCQRIFAGESLGRVQSDLVSSLASSTNSNNNNTPISSHSDSKKGGNNQWKYDVLDARVLSTITAVDMARVWLPRLVRVGKAAREEEKRRAARVGMRKKVEDDKSLSAFEVFVNNVSPSLTKLVEHATFCALGSSSRSGGNDVRMTFGEAVPEKLQTLLRSPLPPSQSTRVGKELAELVELLSQSSGGARSLRPGDDVTIDIDLSPLEDCKHLGDSAVLTIEKRRCIYAFDVCARACSNRASGGGKFDADALVHCLYNLSEQLSRPEECSSEVEKGCELVVRRCCEGLAGFVRDRGDSARLGAVAECADVMSDKISEVVREASNLTPNSEQIRNVMMEDIMGLESAMFDEYLESIRQNVASSVKVGWLDRESEQSAAEKDASLPPAFPPYLSASLLAIVRCRAQVEQALGDKVRRSEGVPYQHLSMATVAEGVVEAICNGVVRRKTRLKVRQADRLANELEFMRATLKKFLGEQTIALLNSTLHLARAKAGRGRDHQDHGPEGLAALEELERLGRVYVLCLGD